MTENRSVIMIIIGSPGDLVEERVLFRAGCESDDYGVKSQEGMIIES
jgi:hypothetical protein